MYIICHLNLSRFIEAITKLETGLLISKALHPSYAVRAKAIAPQNRILLAKDMRTVMSCNLIIFWLSVFEQML